MKSRGFWPIAQKGKSKGGGKFVKGKFSKGQGTSRKSLQQRIMESRCRLCNKVGHWKAECPLRNDAGNNAARSSQAPTSFVQVSAEANEPTALDMEFLQLPLMTETPLDVTQQYIASGFVQQASSAKGIIDPKAKLAQSLCRWNQSVAVDPLLSRIDDLAKIRASLRHRVCTREPDPSQSVSVSSEAAVCFATHGSFGVLDLGATKTVIGSDQVSDFLNSLHPKVRNTVKRCSCNITFRFGNQGTLKSEHAMIVPIEGLLLKIAIVPGSTPFLLSNTLLRALEAVIDTKAQVIVAGKSGRTIPLSLTSKGLFLVDLNDLIGQPGHHAPFSQDAETHSTVDVLSKKPALQHHCTEPSQISMPPCQENRFITIFNKSSQPVTQQSPKVQVPCHVFSQEIASPAPDQDEQPFRSKCDSHRSESNVTGHSHVAVEAPPANAGQEPNDQARLLQDVHGGHGSPEDRFRTPTTGKDLQGCVGSGTDMGDMVCSALRTQPQVRASGLLALCGNEGGACRAHPTGHSCDQPNTKDQDASRPGDQEPGHAKELCSSQGQGSSSPDGDSGGISGVRLRPRSRELRGDPRPGECGKSEPPRGGQPSCPCDGAAPLPDGERDGQSDSALGVSGTDARGCRSVGECPSLAQMNHAGDLSGDCFYSGDFTMECHQERKRLWQLVHQFTSELDQCIEEHASRTSHSPKLSILEVFCGPNSQLTHQARQLGYRAERCGRAQCDLQSVSGRKYVFQQVIERRPKSVWFSPTCGPWAGFSCLNGSRSIKAWDELQRTRLTHLEQVALGIVLFRHQRSVGQHFHWEQPRNSLMFRLPYLQEVLHYLMAVDVDLCIAGDLRDPVNQLPIRKALTILSTSETVIQALTGLRCTGQHSHQPIEGQTRFQGQSMNRSTFTEHYPRKFARLLARVLGKITICPEQPYRHMDATAFAAEHPDAPPPKRAKPAARLTLSRTKPVGVLPWGKRRRCLGKITPVDSEEQWKAIFQKVDQLIPRVGKAEITDPRSGTKSKN